MSCQFKTIESDKIEGVASFVNPSDKKLHKIPHKLLTSWFLFTFGKQYDAGGPFLNWPEHLRRLNLNRVIGIYREEK